MARDYGCSECGSIACQVDPDEELVKQEEYTKRRVVWACSNPYCGRIFQKIDGQQVTLTYRPWKRFPTEDEMQVLDQLTFVEATQGASLAELINTGREGEATK